MADLQQLEDQIVGLSLLDAAQLVKRLEEKLGVSAAADPGSGRRRQATVASRASGRAAEAGEAHAAAAVCRAAEEWWEARRVLQWEVSPVTAPWAVCTAEEPWAAALSIAAVSLTDLITADLSATGDLLTTAVSTAIISSLGIRFPPLALAGPGGDSALDGAGRLGVSAGAGP